jgi:hypothetical protein
MDDPRLILDPRVTPLLATEEQAANYVRQRISAVKRMIQSQPPSPEDSFTGANYLAWHRKTMILYGQAIGSLMGLQAFGIISIPMFKGLKRELLSILTTTMLNVQTGKR